MSDILTDLEALRESFAKEARRMLHELLAGNGLSIYD